MHACKHTSLLGIVSNVPSTVIRINSPVFLRVHITTEQHVFIVETYTRIKLTESVFKSFIINIQPHQYLQSLVYVS
jgi:hypothetical protein